MKSLRKLAGITITLILIFMVIALFRYQAGDEVSLLPEGFEFAFDENWIMAVLDGPAVSLEEKEGYARFRELAVEALKEDGREVHLPYEGRSGESNTLILKNTLPLEYAGLTMNFATAAAEVRVILDDQLIYKSVPGKETYGPSAGSNENYVDIPNVIEEGELWLILSASGPDKAAYIGGIQIETRDMVVIGVVGSSITDIGCCLLILITSIVMFVLAMIRKYTRQPDRGELFLGLAGLAAGIYCFIDTDTLSIFYDVQEAYEMQEYLVLMIPMFLALYFERNLHTVYPRRFFALTWGVIVHAAVQISLHIMGLQELKDMVILSAAVLGVVCVTAIVSLIQLDFRNRRYQALLSTLSMLVLMAGGIANLIINTFLVDLRGNAAGQYSMTIFGIMMSVMHVLQISKEYRANAEEKARAAQQQNMQLAQAKKDADAARHEAQAANEAKGKFLAHMSHEIRTPINAVLGMDEMILRESREPNIKEYAMDIYMAGQTLLSLINDILDFSKIDSGKMEIVPVVYDTSSLIYDLSNMASQRAKDKNISFEVEADSEIPARLYGDDVRIRQVLMNILTNAVKYTHEGRVWLRIQSRRVNDRVALRFEVEDTGIGIKEEDLPKLSAEFERIEEERNRNIEGSGLGMNITIQLLKLLGSRLQVESTYGKGSKFSFELEQEIIDSTPIGDFQSRVHQITENYNYSTKFCAPDAKILVVDDNAVNRKVLRNLLKETQIQVADAGGGAECMELVQKEHFDLIFLDHMMPEMDGVETLHRMKELSAYPCMDTPVVVLTANAVSGAKEKYLAEGFDDFLSKPIVPEKLENMIKDMLPGELLQEDAHKQKTGRDAGSGGAGTMAPGRESKDQGAGEHGGSASHQAQGDFLEKLPQVDGLNWQYAWMYLPDEELLAYTVKEFYAQIDSAADKLEQSYLHIGEEGGLDQYRIQVHAMKSLAANVGIMSLSGLAKILEYAARDGKIETVMSVTMPFLEEWRSYREKLQGVFGIGSGERKEVTDYSVIQALVEMVRISVQEMDIDQADQLMGQLQAYEYSGETGQNIKKLAEAVTNLDIEEADRLADLLVSAKV